MILETKNFEILYGVSKDNKIKTWQIYVERYADFSEIVTLHGYTKKVESRRRINSGKNLNKSNATTHFQQAILEATSKWNKKQNIEQYKQQQQQQLELSMEKLNIDENKNDNEKENNNENENNNEKEHKLNDNGYKKLNDNKNNGDNDKEMRPPLPMLAQDYSKQKQKIKFPCYVQPKLDGYRMLYNSDKKTITTRQGKEFSIIKQAPVLYKELCSIPPGIILDGELYVHNELSFETLGVLRKTKKLTKQDQQNLDKIEYHVYDIIDTKNTFNVRNNILNQLFESNNFKMIKNVFTLKVENEEQIKQNHLIFVNEQGFEGTMIRNSSGMYKEKFRSFDLLKYKDFMDAEFEIVDYTFEKDTSQTDNNLIVWIIKIKDNILCKVRPKGTKEQRQELYKKCKSDFSQFKGRKLWTKFFEYTTDGNLRFPTTKCNSYIEYIRDEVI